MTMHRYGPRMQSFNIGDDLYPEMTPLPVRTSVEQQLGEYACPNDKGVVHEDHDFPIRWLRHRAPGFQDVPLAAGVLSMKPCILDFTFVGDETILLVSGAIDVVDHEGHVARLRTGDMAFFAAGTSTTWSVLEQSVELFTILG